VAIGALVSPRVTRSRLTLLLAVVSLVALAVPVAQASSVRRVERYAVRAANHYTDTQEGVGYPGIRGTARCHKVARLTWRCSVNLTGDGCRGTLKVRDVPHWPLISYAYRIGCPE
jgi:hypothetical protein